ncbi:MAG: NUDIX domain-containing protein [Actinomycetota bacterium]|nr:NUDIX domain-containing protein [Actinomycetota bacterium]
MAAAHSRPVSAGVLMYRIGGDGEVEVLIGHPGGPFWARKDAGAWTIPKGLANGDEDLEAAARREFTEETGAAAPQDLVDLGVVVQRAGKRVHAFAGEGDLDPATVVSNLVSVTWPPRSGRTIEVPEIDRVSWVSLDEARRLLNPAQAGLVDRLADHLRTRDR